MPVLAPLLHYKIVVRFIFLIFFSIYALPSIKLLFNTAITTNKESNKKGSAGMGIQHAWERSENMKGRDLMEDLGTEGHKILNASYR
jgi:hypothetical protein